MLKWLFTTASYLCFLLLLTPTASHANIDFVGSNVIITDEKSGEVYVVNVKKLLQDKEVTEDQIVEYVLKRYKSMKNENIYLRK